MGPDKSSNHDSYAQALAAFKRECNENEVIARLLREELHHLLVPPVLDVGAGSGDVAARGFPDQPAFLLDVDPYEATNPKHERIKGDFMQLDFGKLRPQTILFCHSLYNFWDDMEPLRRQLRSSGASTALVVTKIFSHADRRTEISP